MKFTLFKKHLILSALVITTFAVLGLLSAFIVSHFQRNQLMVSPFASVARLVDTTSQREGKSLEESLTDVINQSALSNDNIKFSVLTKNDLRNTEFGSAIKNLPEKPYQSTLIESGLFSPPKGEVIRLNAKADTFLIVQFQGGGPFPPPPGAKGFPPPMMGSDSPSLPLGPPPRPPGGMSHFFILNFGALLVSVFLGSAVSLFILFYSMREKGRLADQVLSEIHAGNLKARFPIKRVDEVGNIMLKFNRMADEIEHLVDQLKATEAARTRLLQELAHDLRTPIASLKNFVETLSFRDATLKESDRSQLLNLSRREIEYFEHLVEDLLFLAQVKDPKYEVNVSSVDIVDLIEEEISSTTAKYERGNQIQVSRKFPSAGATLLGDPLLLRRLFRNAFENAFSFASTSIQINVAVTKESIDVTIYDDGPGLSDEALAGFGEKRTTRIFDNSRNGRLSVGLGSVIMKAVVNAHHGEMSICNRSIEESRSGTELKFSLRAA